MTLSRRALLAAAGPATLLTFAAPGMVMAAPATDRRFVFIIQRGAADSLGILAPTGDPAFAAARGVLAEDFASAPTLGGLFALHPALAETSALYGKGEALFAHAVASPYRERSHFDGQNVLETGGAAAYAVKDGWLNRLLTLLPRTDAKAIAIAATVPVALRGPVEVASYAPSNLPDASDDLLARVGALYESDAQLHALWQQANATRMLAGDLAAEAGRNAAATGALAARMLAAPAGERVAMIETGGWDTHAGQRGRLTGQLRGLDAMIGALRTGLGEHWASTLVLVATEFGRTVKVNGTQGTDHGTGAMAMLIGGAVKGGRIVADWPGLAPAKLLEQRDLRPTLGLDALIASAVAQHFALDRERVAATLFPSLPRSADVQGLIRA
ncbi:DUF1501 domain-containing protein [Sphingomonas sp. FW199]|uniref:DUF1501 domain-containing protein n=1 Tax=Sphingomonas sp. FW199 TaxID=3400217 RepID=UPI003CE74E34